VIANITFTGKGHVITSRSSKKWREQMARFDEVKVLSREIAKVLLGKAEEYQKKDEDLGAGMAIIITAFCDVFATVLSGAILCSGADKSQAEDLLSHTLSQVRELTLEKIKEHKEILKDKLNKEEVEENAEETLQNIFNIKPRFSTD
jgi:hypothetical protein